MKSTLLFGLIAVTQAITVQPVENKANVTGPTNLVEDFEKKKELKITLDSLQQAEKELGVKMDAPKKEVVTKYDGIGADTPLANQHALDQQEDEENTMASFEEAKKEANAVQSASQIKMAAQLEQKVQAKNDEEKQKDANSK